MSEESLKSLSGLLMARVQLPTKDIADFASFHLVCKQEFGFPDFYGMNGDAWIDCLTYLDDGMSRFDLESLERLEIEVLNTEQFISRVPDVFMAFVTWTAFINGRRHVDEGLAPRLVLIFV